MRYIFCGPIIEYLGFYRIRNILNASPVNDFFDPTFKLYIYITDTTVVFVYVYQYQFEFVANKLNSVLEYFYFALFKITEQANSIFLESFRILRNAKNGRFGVEYNIIGIAA